MDSPFPPGSALACYCRDSGGAAQDLSVDQQLAVIEEWCKTSGYTLTAVFADRARSGGSLAGRDQFEAMFRHFQRGAPEAGVVFWDLSRWSRDYDTGQFYLSSLRRLGYSVHSLEQYIPPGSIGRVVESLHLWSAEEYRKQLASNVRRGLYYVITVHRAYPRPWVPLGLRKAPVVIGTRRDGQPHIVNRLEPDPSAAPLVARAFALRADGRTLSEIHNELHLFPDRFGYRRMFRQQLYRGVYQYGSLVVDDFCEPIIDAGTWRAVQQINADWNERNLHPRRAASSFLLSGLARCGLCGYAMTGDSTHKGYRYYHCTAIGSLEGGCKNKRIRAADLDAAVLRLALDFVSDETVLQSLVEAVRLELASQPDDSAANLQRIQADVRSCEQAIDNLLRTLEMTGTSRAIAERLRELEQQRGDLTERLGEAQRALDARNGYDPDAAGQAAVTARLGLAQVDLRDRQLALRSIVREVRAVSGAGGVVVFSLPGLGIDKTIEFRL